MTSQQKPIEPEATTPCDHPEERRSWRTGARLPHCGKCGETIHPPMRASTEATERPDLRTAVRAALEPITDEWRVFERAYQRAPTLADMVSRYVEHRRVPQRWDGERWTGGYDCSGNPCRCGADALVAALTGASPSEPSSDDLDGERLYRTYWRVQWANPGLVVFIRQWEQLTPEEQDVWHQTAAALTGASPSVSPGGMW